MAERRPPAVAPHRAVGEPRERSSHGAAPQGQRPAVQATAQSQTQADRTPVQSPRQRREPSTVSVRMQERLAERKRTERRKVAVSMSRWLALIGAVGAALWAVMASPMFSLDPAKVSIDGYSAEIAGADVEAVIAQYHGESLALLNVPHVADQLRDVTGVLDATVERVWPDGLRVTLVPRQPVAAIPNEAGFSLVDADAVVVGTTETAPLNVPVLSIPAGDERILDAALEVIRNVPTDIRAQITSMGAQTEDSVSFQLASGLRVDWGSASDSALKAQVLEAMMASGATAGAAVVDVSAPTMPITKASP